MNFIKGENNHIVNTKEVTENKFWYAIYTNPRAEKKVFERLVEAEIEAFLPLETQIRFWSDRKKKVIVPLIKSYVFVKVEEKDIIKKVLTVFGAVMALRHMGKYAKIKEYEIENLRILSENSSKVVSLSSKIDVEIGEIVEVVRGSFAGLKGKCMRVKGTKSVLIEMDLLGSLYSVEVPPKYLKCGK